LRAESWMHRFSAAGCWAQAGNFHEAITLGEELLTEADLSPGCRNAWRRIRRRYAGGPSNGLWAWRPSRQAASRRRRNGSCHWDALHSSIAVCRTGACKTGRYCSATVQNLSTDSLRRAQHNWRCCGWVANALQPSG
jgi:hypothetical protein